MLSVFATRSEWSYLLIHPTKRSCLTLREDAQTAEMELIAAQYRGGARVLQAKLFVLSKHAFWWRELNLEC